MASIKGKSLHQKMKEGSGKVKNVVFKLSIELDKNLIKVVVVELQRELQREHDSRCNY